MQHLEPLDCLKSCEVPFLGRRLVSTVASQMPLGLGRSADDLQKKCIGFIPSHLGIIAV